MTHLNVAVRVRPLSDREKEVKAVPVVEIFNNNAVAVTNLKVLENNAGDSRERVRRFSFDHCFDESASQEQVFEAVENVIGGAVRKKYHACVLAYGQSSSGKTRTIMGVDEDPGLTPRLCESVFGYVREMEPEEEAKGVAVSYLEIYNEKVKDLLGSGNRQNSLKVREHPNKGTYVQGLTHHAVTDPTTLLERLQTGNKRRRVSATSVNHRSSRSHSVFTITCFGGVKLTLVDLAGSERTGSRSFNNTSTFREGANINKSLVALGNVIFALADQSKSLRRRYVPYRDSVLTWLLKDTLGGNSKTVMIATISPSHTCYNETVNTLRFGHRAKQIIAQPISNEDPKQKTIRDLKTEVARLKDLLLKHEIDPHLQCRTPGNSEVATLETIDRSTNTEEASLDENLQLTRKILDGLLEQIKAKLKEDFRWCKEELLRNTGGGGDGIFGEIIRNSFGKRLVCKKNITQIYNVPEFKVFVYSDGKTIPTIKGVPQSTSENPNVVSESLTVKDQARDVTERGPKTHEVGSKSNTTAKKPDLKVLRASTEELIPVMDVSSAVSGPEKPLVKLRRTFSVCSAEMESKKTKMYGSFETLSKYHQQQPEPQLRKRSLDKSSSSVRNLKDKASTESVPEKTGSANDVSRSFSKVEAKVDSIRKSPKPRAEIVAAVTQRLYTKTKKKEVATETDDVTKEHKGTSARIRLQDITQRALRACRRRHAESQTEALPILRVKETGTDVQDLKVEAAEVRHVHVSTREVITRDAGINHTHTFDHPAGHSLVLTKSCGVQVSPTPNREDQQSLFSFTKYLRPQKDPRIEVSHRATANPIYTSSVNINVSHNYINRKDSISGDSLEDQTNANAISLPTPDLISNHSSLEAEKANQVEALGLPQACTIEEEHCRSLPEYQPKTCKVKVTQTQPHETSFSIEQPAILKSIVKQSDDLDQSDCASDDPSPRPFADVPDSLPYHANKTVRFDEEEPMNGRILEVMTNFLKEATTLMTNLAAAATDRPDVDRAYDLQVTVSDAGGNVIDRKPRRRPRRRRPRKNEAGSQTCGNAVSQTSPKRTCEKSVETDGEVPENKYECLVRKACDRLERCAAAVSADWYGPGRPEDSSLESNVTFSDYGSLPRQKLRCKASCSPRAFLKELTSVRKQVVDSSREELISESHG